MGTVWICRNGSLAKDRPSRINGRAWPGSRDADTWGRPRSGLRHWFVRRRIRTRISDRPNSRGEGTATAFIIGNRAGGTRNSGDVDGGRPRFRYPIAKLEAQRTTGRPDSGLSLVVNDTRRDLGRGFSLLAEDCQGSSRSIDGAPGRPGLRGLDWRFDLRGTNAAGPGIHEPNHEVRARWTSRYLSV